MMTSPCIVAVVPAAGIGSRMQTSMPKQYLQVHNKTILEHTLETLISHPRISLTIVALHPQDTLFNTLPVSQDPRIRTVVGGQARSESVVNALDTMAEDSWALVHDAARPCVSRNDITKLIETAQGAGGAILATQVRDTMKRAKGEYIMQTVERANLWHALTPQLFNAGELKAAYKKALQKHLPVTDEASAMEHAGHSVQLVLGSATNIKVTQPEDLALAAFYLQKENT